MLLNGVGIIWVSEMNRVLTLASVTSPGGNKAITIIWSSANSPRSSTSKLIYAVAQQSGADHKVFILGSARLLVGVVCAKTIDLAQFSDLHEAFRVGLS